MDAEFLEQLKKMAEMEIPDEFESHQTDKPQEDKICTFLPDTKSEHQMPAYLKEQIINRAKQPDMQPVSSKRKRSKRMELFLYSCKVTVAVAASLVIIITLSATQGAITELPHRDTSAIENQQLETATDNLIREDAATEQDFSEQNKISQKISESSESITDWLQDFPGKLFKQQK